MLKTKLELGLKGLYQSKTFYNAFFNETWLHLHVSQEYAWVPAL